jgi:hypothetical protein
MKLAWVGLTECRHGLENRTTPIRFAVQNGKEDGSVEEEERLQLWQRAR